MRGLIYKSDAVEIDEAFATNLAGIGDAVAAREAFSDGVGCVEGNDRTGAIGAFTRAVILGGGLPEHYAALGEALLRKDMLDQAVAAFRTALRLDASLAGSRFGLATALERLDRRREAAMELREILAQDPTFGDAHARLAVLAYYDGDLSAAAEHLDAAESLGAPTPTVLRTLMTQPESLHAAVRTPRSGGALVGPQTRIDVGGGTFAANETSIVAGPGVNPIMIGTWNDWRHGGGFGSIVRMGVGVSSDGGFTWTDFLVRPPAPFQSNVEGDPMTAIDPRTGAMWVGAISFAGNGGVYVARFEPGSTTPNPSVMARTTGSADKGWMAAGPGPGNPNETRVYIAYNQGMLRSTDMGNTWSAPVSLGSGIGFLPRIGPGGELYVAYWNLGNGFFIRRSFDGGASFGTPIRIVTRLSTLGIGSTGFPGTFRVAPLAGLAVDQADGALFATWWDTTSIVSGHYNNDVYFARSLDQGLTWSTPLIVNGDAVPTGDQFFPWIEVDDRGRLHLVYLDTRHVAQNDASSTGFIDAYYAYSDDRGDSWTEARLTPSSFNSELDGRNELSAFIGDYLGMAVSGSLVVPSYPSNQNGDSDIFVHRIGGLLGDMNCDGLVTPGDIAPFVLAITDPASYAVSFPDCNLLHGDLNGDGIVSPGDIAPFVQVLTGG